MSLKEEFCRPKCSSTKFSSSTTRAGTIKGRICGECSFTWDPLDDWKYFRIIVKADDATDNVKDVVRSAVRQHVLSRNNQESPKKSVLDDFIERLEADSDADSTRTEISLGPEILTALLED